MINEYKEITFRTLTELKKTLKYGYGLLSYKEQVELHVLLNSFIRLTSNISERIVAEQCVNYMRSLDEKGI